MPLAASSADALIEAALPLFGTQGLEGTSTRDIARAAGKPMSAITYYFGGKEALYLACARHIGDTIGGLVSRAFDDAGSAIHNPADARIGLSRLVSALIAAILRDETAEFARFIVREQQEPTAAFDVIYSGMMGKMLARMVELMTVVAGARVDDIEIRVRVIALMGQVVAFRIARAATLRLTGWTAIGDDERAVIERVVQAQLTAVIDGLEREQGV